MEQLHNFHIQLSKSLAPVGRAILFPYCLIRVLLQWYHYTSINTLSLAKLYILYYYNVILMVNESHDDYETFDASYEQKKQYNLTRVYNYNRPIAADVKQWFEAPLTLNEIYNKSWLRTDYYWDRYIIHTPFCMYRRLRRLRTPYIYDPHALDTPDNEVKNIPNDKRNVFSIPDLTDIDSGEEEDETRSNLNEYESSYIKRSKLIESSNHNIHGFTPKPYILTSESIRKNHSGGKLVSQVSDIKNSSMINLFEPQPVQASLPILPVRQEQAETVEESPVKSRDRSSSGIFYKIKVRRRKPSNPPNADLTVGNYDLVRQAIKDCLPMPDFDDGSLGPNMVRLAWHCCAHYDKVTGTGGCNGGTMRFAQEFNDPGNTGLHTAKSYLDQIHEKFNWISFADLYTLGAVVAIEEMGGPTVYWKPGRTDCPDPAKVPPMGRLPLATLGTDHIREVFTQRLGFNDQEIVALIGGGHTLGGCHAKYSGFSGQWTDLPIVFDNDFFKVLLDDTWSPGIVPQTGNSQYYNHNKHLMMLNTDMELLKNPDFRKWVEIYANDSTRFMDDFAIAFCKLLELGVNRDSDGMARTKI